jgi:hypothetical protein
VLTFDRALTSEADLTRVREIVQKHPGQQALEFVFTSAASTPVRLRAGREFRMTLDASAKDELAPWLTR